MTKSTILRSVGLFGLFAFLLFFPAWSMEPPVDEDEAAQKEVFAICERHVSSGRDTRPQYPDLGRIITDMDNALLCVKEKGDDRKCIEWFLAGAVIIDWDHAYHWVYPEEAASFKLLLANVGEKPLKFSLPCFERLTMGVQYTDASEEAGEVRIITCDFECLKNKPYIPAAASHGFKKWGPRDWNCSRTVPFATFEWGDGGFVNGAKTRR